MLYRVAKSRKEAEFGALLGVCFEVCFIRVLLGPVDQLEPRVSKVSIELVVILVVYLCPLLSLSCVGAAGRVQPKRLSVRNLPKPIASIYNENRVCNGAHAHLWAHILTTCNTFGLTVEKP